MSTEFDNVPMSDASVIQHHSRSFSLAAKMLPRAIRADVVKLYAWCRWCDDAVDEASNSQKARECIKLLKKDVEKIYQGASPEHAASLWLESLVTKYGIPQQWPLDLLKGMESDVNAEPIQTLEELIEYCYQVAGTVGLMMAKIMGADGGDALDCAKALGMAMQLTNIARDVDEDWRRGRRYIPKEWLFLIPKKDVSPTNEQVRRGVEELLILADEYYQCGYAGLMYLPNGCRMAIRLAGKIYQEIGHEIRRQDFCVMHQRVFVGKKDKLRLVLSCLKEEFAYRAGNFSRNAVNPAAQKGVRDSNDPKPKTITRLASRRSQEREITHLGYHGMAAVMFFVALLLLLVGLNPKGPDYSYLPWVYAACCGAFSAGCAVVARRINRNRTCRQLARPSQRSPPN